MNEPSEWARGRALQLLRPAWNEFAGRTPEIPIFPFDRWGGEVVRVVALGIDEALAEGIRRGREQAARELTDAAVSASLEAKE